MNGPLDLVGAVAIGAATILASLSLAHADDTTHPLTLADCPSGYVLAVQDTEQPMMPTRTDNTDAPNGQGIDPNTTITLEQLIAAPHRFVTGCIPPTPQTQGDYYAQP